MALRLASGVIVISVEGVAAVEELADVLADAVIEKELTSWVRVNE